MIIHINQDRYARILAQGYSLYRHIQPKVISVQQAEGDVEYHTLQGEHGTCAVCGVETDSVDAERSGDLQYIEMAMREPDKAKAGEIMDYMRAMRLRTLGRITDEQCANFLAEPLDSQAKAIQTTAQSIINECCGQFMKEDYDLLERRIIAAIEHFKGKRDCPSCEIELSLYCSHCQQEFEQ